MTFSIPQRLFWSADHVVPILVSALLFVLVTPIYAGLLLASSFMIAWIYCFDGYRSKVYATRYIDSGGSFSREFRFGIVTSIIFVALALLTMVYKPEIPNPNVLWFDSSTQSEFDELVQQIPVYLKGDASFVRIPHEQCIVSIFRGEVNCDAAGMYEARVDVVQIIEDDIDTMRINLYHEIGHRVWWQVLDKEERMKYETLGGESITSYAASSVTEDFAENFRHHYIKNFGDRNQTREKEIFITKTIQKAVKKWSESS